MLVSSVPCGPSSWLTFVMTFGCWLWLCLICHEGRCWSQQSCMWGSWRMWDSARDGFNEMSSVDSGIWLAGPQLVSLIVEFGTYDLVTFQLALSACTCGSRREISGLCSHCHGFALPAQTLTSGIAHINGFSFARLQCFITAIEIEK